MGCMKTVLNGFPGSRGTGLIGQLTSVFSGLNYDTIGLQRQQQDQQHHLFFCSRASWQGRSAPHPVHELSPHASETYTSGWLVPEGETRDGLLDAAVRETW